MCAPRGELVNGNRDEMDIGPLHAEILEPMRRVAFPPRTKNDTESATTLRTPPTSRRWRPKRLISMVDDRRVWDWSHFSQSSGRGLRPAWATASSRSLRRSHWAIRDRPGVSGRARGARGLVCLVPSSQLGQRYKLVCVQVESFYLWYFQTQDEDGTPRFFKGLVRWSEGGGVGRDLTKSRAASSSVPASIFHEASKWSISKWTGASRKDASAATTVHSRGHYGGYNWHHPRDETGSVKVAGDAGSRPFAQESDHPRHTPTTVSRWRTRASAGAYF